MNSNAAFSTPLVWSRNSNTTGILTGPRSSRPVSHSAVRRQALRCSSAPPTGTADDSGTAAGDSIDQVSNVSSGTKNYDPVEGVMSEADFGLNAALDRSWDTLASLDESGFDPFIQDGPTKKEPAGYVAVEGVAADAVQNQPPPASISVSEATEKEDIDTEKPPAHVEELQEGLQENILGTGVELAAAGVTELGMSEQIKTRRGRPKKASASSTATATKAKKPRKRTTSKTTASAVSSSATDVFLEEAKAHAAVWDEAPKWFFLQVKPGCEQSCAISLRNLGKSLPGLGVREVTVPAMKIMRLTKGGKSVSKEERIYPSYILIHMRMSNESYSKVQAVPNVQFFMGDPNRDKKKGDPFMPPMPVSGSELSNVFDRMKTAEMMSPQSRTVLRPGGTVRVRDGEYKDLLGKIMEVKPDLNSVTVQLQHLTRWIKVALGISEVETVSNRELEKMKVMEESKEKIIDAVDEEEDEFMDATIVENKKDVKKKGSNMKKKKAEMKSEKKQEEMDTLIDMLGGMKEGGKEGKEERMPTVLDTLNEPASAPRSRKDAFDDLFEDDLPDLPTKFGGGNVSKGSRREGNESGERRGAKGKKDPMQDLLDLFGENEEDKNGALGDLFSEDEDNTSARRRT